MLSILWVRLKRFKENLPILFGMTAMAFGIIAVFGNAMNSGYKPIVYIVNHNETPNSIEFIQQLSETDLFHFKEVSYSEAVEALESYNGIAAVVIEEDFLLDANNSISTMKISASMEYSNLILLLQSKIARYSNQVSFANEIKAYLSEEDVVFNEQEIDNNVALKYKEGLNAPTYRSNSYLNEGNITNNYATKQSIIGFTIFFSMYTMVFAIAEIIEEKRLRVYHRQLVSSLTSNQIIMGNLIYTFFLGFLQVMGMILLGQFFFGIDWGGNIGAIAIVLAAFVFCVTCLGLFMTSLVKSMQQLGALAPMILTGTAMIGGCMWPREMMQNRILLFISDFTPQRWAVSGISNLVLFGQGTGVIFLPSSILLGMGLLFFFLGIKRIKSV